MMTAKKREAFDYAGLDDKAVSELREKAKAIRRRVMATVEEVFGIGRDLIAAKRVLGERFDQWVAFEVGVPVSSARDWVKATECFAARSGVPFERFTLAALYDLSRDNVPEPARAEAVKRAKAGEEITRPVSREIKARHIPDPEPPAAAASEPVPTVPGVYFATFHAGLAPTVVVVKRDGIPHLRAYVPGVAKSFDLTAFCDYSERITDPRGNR